VVLTLLACSHCLPKWKEPARRAADERFNSWTSSSDSSGSVVLLVMTIIELLSRAIYQGPARGFVIKDKLQLKLKFTFALPTTTADL